jgi:NADP-dependent 3-hydroxy acid dehydrogenase YdfG
MDETILAKARDVIITSSIASAVAYFIGLIGGTKRVKKVVEELREQNKAMEARILELESMKKNDKAFKEMTITLQDNQLTLFEAMFQLLQNNNIGGNSENPRDKQILDNAQEAIGSSRETMMSFLRGLT